VWQLHSLGRPEQSLQTSKTHLLGGVRKGNWAMGGGLTWKGGILLYQTKRGEKQGRETEIQKLEGKRKKPKKGGKNLREKGKVGEFWVFLDSLFRH